MTSHSRCAKDSASCDTKFCLLREHWVLVDVLLKNFLAAYQSLGEACAILGFQFFKILSRLTCFITFSLATIQVSIIHVTVTKVSLAQSVSELHCN